MRHLLLVALTVTAVATLMWFVPQATSAPGVKPSDGFSLHIDGQLHFPGKPSMIAHHWCKTGIPGFVAECQLYESDGANARLVGVEVVVTADVWKTFSASERALWHYHKTEIPKIKATLPDLSPEEAAKVAKSLEETYGKIYLLWDPGRQSLPIGRPSLTVIK